MRLCTGWGLVGLLAASFALASCDQNRPASGTTRDAAQPTSAAASTDGPPTDAEILSAFTAYWNQTVPQHFGAIGQEEYRLVSPIGAHQLEGGVTSDTYAGKRHSVSVAFSFRANGPLNYQCTDAWGFAVLADAAQAGTTPKANTGDVFSCTKAEQFAKVDQGWVASFDMSGNGFLINR